MTFKKFLFNTFFFSSFFSVTLFRISLNTDWSKQPKIFHAIIQWWVHWLDSILWRPDVHTYQSHLPVQPNICKQEIAANYAVTGTTSSARISRRLICYWRMFWCSAKTVGAEGTRWLLWAQRLHEMRCS